jgi:hypothetical protein
VSDDYRTRAEYDALVAEVEALLPVPMRHPLSGRVAPVSPANVPARLTAGWTLVEPTTRNAAV